MKYLYFLVFNFFKKMEIIKLFSKTYLLTTIINAIQTAVIDQFIALKNMQKNEFYLKQTKIKLCSVVGYYRFLLFDLSRILIECSVNGFYSLIIINYGQHITYHFGITLLNTSMC